MARKTRSRDYTTFVKSIVNYATAGSDEIAARCRAIGERAESNLTDDEVREGMAEAEAQIEAEYGKGRSLDQRDPNVNPQRAEAERPSFDDVAHAHKAMLGYLSKHVDEFGTDYGTIHAIEYSDHSIPKDALFAMWCDGTWLEHFDDGASEQLNRALGRGMFWDSPSRGKIYVVRR